MTSSMRLCEAQGAILNSIFSMA